MYVRGEGGTGNESGDETDLGDVWMSSSTNGSGGGGGRIAVPVGNAVIEVVGVVVDDDTT